MKPIEGYLQNQLAERTRNGNLRTLTSWKGYLDFVSNDYLGLAATGILDRLVAAMPYVNNSHGATGSRLLSGNYDLIEQLELQISQFHEAEAALVFNSGYNANIGLITAITNKHTLILFDELCHASLIDGIRLSISPQKYKFGHNNLPDLAKKLERFKTIEHKLVIVESIYSMDGDSAPLIELVALCENYDAELIVDEAHATGVVGGHGEGWVDFLHLRDKIFASIHTFGKALGCHGAAIVGSNLLKQYLINFSRPFIYTTALPPISIKAASAAYNYLASPDFSNKYLHDLIQYFRNKIAVSKIKGWVDSFSAIQALIIGSNEICKAVTHKLQTKGFDVRPILSPTVPFGKERIRFCLHVFNTCEEIDGLFEVLN